MRTETFCHLTIPKEVVSQPIIYWLKKKYDLVPNIFRAEVTEDEGWMVVRLEGEETNIQRSLLELKCLGIRVEEGKRDDILKKKEAEKIVGVRLRLIIPPNEIGEPVINDLIEHCEVVPNLKRARISEEEAWVDLEISGSSRDIDKATDFLKNRKITVNAIEGDVIE